MRYTYFEIDSFKGIHKLRLDFSSPPRSPIYTLVGLNESGKTTVLEAINSFTYGSEDLHALQMAGYAKPDIHDLVPIAERADFNGQIVIRAGVELAPSDLAALSTELRAQHQVHSVQCEEQLVVADIYPFTNSKHDPKSKRRTWSFTLKVRRGSQRSPRLVPSSDEVWRTAVKFLGLRMPRIWYFPSFLLDFPDKIYLEDYPDLSESMRKKHTFYRNIVQSMLASVRESATVADHLVARAKSSDSNDKRNLDGLKLEMGRSMTGRIFRAWNDMFEKQVTDKRIVVDVTHDSDRVSLRLQIEDNDGYFAIGERSLGFRWFFAYLIITSYTGAPDSNPHHRLLLFDEPASNLHSTAQSRLLKSFRELGKNSTIIYTTHSHHLIDPDWLESTFVVRNLGIEYTTDDEDFTAKRTDIKLSRYRDFAGGHPDQAAYFQPILDVLDYQPSRLEMVPDLILVEGKNDFYTLNYGFAFILKKETRLGLTPGGGAGSLDQLIQLYLGWARNFIVLLDSDEEGSRRQRKRYEEKFGLVVKDRLTTLSEAIPELIGAGCEQLFLQDEALSIQQISYPNSNVLHKKQFNRGVQEAFLRSLEVPISPITQTKLEQLYKHLVNKLTSVKKQPR